MRKSGSVSEEELNKPDSVNVLNNMYSRYCNESGSVHDNVLTGIKNFVLTTQKTLTVYNSVQSDLTAGCMIYLRYLFAQETSKIWSQLQVTSCWLQVLFSL